MATSSLGSACAEDGIPLKNMSEEERLALREMRLQAGEISSELKNINSKE